MAPGKEKTYSQLPVDGLSQVARIGLVVELLQGIALVVGQDLSSTEALEGSLSWAVATARASSARPVGEEGFLFEAEHGLEGVVVEPEFVVEIVESHGLGG